MPNSTQRNTKIWFLVVFRRSIDELLSGTQEQATDLSELGAKFNAFSLEEHQALASAIEKVGQAIDNSYISTEALVSGLSTSFAEPLSEVSTVCAIVRSVLKFRKQKALQYEITTESLASKKATLETLERTEQEAQRMMLIYIETILVSTAENQLTITTLVNHQTLLAHLRYSRKVRTSRPLTTTLRLYILLQARALKIFLRLPPPPLLPGLKILVRYSPRLMLIPSL